MLPTEHPTNNALPTGGTNSDTGIECHHDTKMNWIYTNSVTTGKKSV